MDDRYLIEDGFHFVNRYYRSSPKQSKFIKTLISSTVFFTVLVNLINNCIYWEYLQKLQTFYFLRAILFSVRRQKTLSQRTMQWGTDLKNQALRKDRPMYAFMFSLLCLNRRNFRS